MHSSQRSIEQHRASLYQTTSQLYRLHRRLKQQERDTDARLNGLLAEWQENEQQTFTTKDFLRFKKYWQLGFHVIGDSYYRLIGKQLSEAEAKRILMLSVFGPLYDDLFDNGITSMDRIEQLTHTPEAFAPTNFPESIVKKVYLHLLQEVPSRESVIDHLGKVYHWQNESLKQLQPGIGEEELYEITYRKSYYSILLYLSVLDTYPSEAIVEMLYPMAGLLQLTNDAFDVYKDIQGGVYTIPNVYPDYPRIQERFLQDIHLFNRQLSALPVSGQGKRNYSITLHAMHAMGWMALQQLKAVTGNTNDPAVLRKSSRKQLVCDMDSVPQIIRWVKSVKYLVNYQ